MNNELLPCPFCGRKEYKTEKAVRDVWNRRVRE